METASVSATQATLATQLASITFIMSPVATEQFHDTHDCRLYISCVQAPGTIYQMKRAYRSIWIDSNSMQFSRYNAHN